MADRVKAIEVKAPKAATPAAPMPEITVKKMEDMAGEYSKVKRDMLGGELAAEVSPPKISPAAGSAVSPMPLGPPPEMIARVIFHHEYS